MISAATGSDILRKSNKSLHHPHGGKTVERLVESAKVGKSSGSCQVVKKFVMDPAPHGKSVPSSLNDTFEQSETARETANPVHFDGTKEADENSLRTRYRRTGDILREATDSNRSTDARASQDGEQSNDDVLTDHCVEGNRWKSELTDASTGLSMIGKKPDDLIGSLWERLREQPSQSLGEAPNDHDSSPTQESLCPPSRAVQSEPKDGRSSQDREPIVDGIVILYRTLVKDRALPPCYVKEFSTLGPVLDDAADRQLQKNAAIDNEQAAVLLYDFHRQKMRTSEATKSAVDQFVAAARDKPRSFRTRLQKMLYNGPTPRKDAEEMERAPLIETLSTLLRATQTPMGRMLIDKPQTAQLLGAGRRVTTLRSRVTQARRKLAWLSINFEATFPADLEHMVDC